MSDSAHLVHSREPGKPRLTLPTRREVLTNRPTQRQECCASDGPLVHDNQHRAVRAGRHYHISRVVIEKLGASFVQSRALGIEPVAPACESSRDL
jgi:hypothetical protein